MGLQQTDLHIDALTEQIIAFPQHHVGFAYTWCGSNIYFECAALDLANLLLHFLLT
ncbi:hypothetical protein D3C74_474310 [compost metagenome]